MGGLSSRLPIGPLAPPLLHRAQQWLASGEVGCGSQALACLQSLPQPGCCSGCVQLLPVLPQLVHGAAMVVGRFFLAVGRFSMALQHQDPVGFLACKVALVGRYFEPNTSRVHSTEAASSSATLEPLAGSLTLGGLHQHA